MKDFVSMSAITGLLVVLIIPFLVLIGFAHAYVIQLYWSWFLIPIFPTLLPLTIGKAYGLCMFVGFFLLNVSRYDHDAESKTILWTS